MTTTKNNTEEDSVYDADDELCDMEVQYFMRNQIRRDECICKKYRDPVSTKKCSLCSQDPSNQARKVNPVTRDVNRTSSARARSRGTSDSPSKGQGHQYSASFSKEFSMGTRMKKKRKPKVIPATEYIAQYYSNQSIKFGGSSSRSRGSICEQKRLLAGDTSDVTSASTSTNTTKEKVDSVGVKKIDVKSGDSLANELSRIFI